MKWFFSQTRNRGGLAFVSYCKPRWWLLVFGFRMYLLCLNTCRSFLHFLCWNRLLLSTILQMNRSSFTLELEILSHLGVLIIVGTAQLKWFMHVSFRWKLLPGNSKKRDSGMSERSWLSHDDIRRRMQQSLPAERRNFHIRHLKAREPRAQ